MKTCGHECFEEGCVHCEAEFQTQEADDKRQALCEVRALVAELYAIRGEDGEIARLCQEAMRIADAYS